MPPKRTGGIPSMCKTQFKVEIICENLSTVVFLFYFSLIARQNKNWENNKIVEIELKKCNFKHHYRPKKWYGHGRTADDGPACDRRKPDSCNPKNDFDRAIFAGAICTTVILKLHPLFINICICRFKNDLFPCDL